MPNRLTLTLRRNDGAACHGESDEVFSPDRNNKETIAAFKNICEQCPVLDTCRDLAYVYDEYTNLGGTTPRERTAFRRTGDYLRLLIRAAEEGWLEYEALADETEIAYARRKALGDIEPTLFVGEFIVEEIDVDFSYFLAN